MSVTLMEISTARVCLCECVWNVSWRHIQAIRSVSPRRPKQIAFVMFVTPSGQSWNYRPLWLDFTFFNCSKNIPTGLVKKAPGFMYRRTCRNQLTLWECICSVAKVHVALVHKVLLGKAKSANIKQFDLLPRWDGKKRLMKKDKEPKKTGA